MQGSLFDWLRKVDADLCWGWRGHPVPPLLLPAAETTAVILEPGAKSATDYIFAPYSSIIALGRCGRVRIETDLLVDA